MSDARDVTVEVGLAEVVLVLCDQMEVYPLDADTVPEFLTALRAAATLPPSTVTEWGVRGVPKRPEVWKCWCEDVARLKSAQYGGTVVTRQRTSYADTVTEWTKADQ